MARLSRRRLAASLLGGSAALITGTKMVAESTTEMPASQAKGWDRSSTIPVVFELGNRTLRIPRDYVSTLGKEVRDCNEGQVTCGRDDIGEVALLLPDFRAIDASLNQEYRIIWPPDHAELVQIDLMAFSQDRRDGFLEALAFRDYVVMDGELEKESGLGGLVRGRAFDGRVVGVDVFSGECRLTSYLDGFCTVYCQFNVKHLRDWFYIDKGVVTLINSWTAPKQI